LIEEEPQSVHQLVHNMLQEHPKPLEFLVSSIHRDVFLVGAPLLVALWNVMKNEIDQIPVQELGKMFRAEQERIIAASIKMIGLRHSVKAAKDKSTGVTISAFEALMNVHSRRFPVTIFLLCELMVVDPALITPECLKFMLLLGNYLEWEGTLCHDLAFYELAQTTNTNNAYLFWLNENNKLYDANSEDTKKAFLEATAEFLNTKKYKLLAIRDHAPFFDVSGFLQNTKNSVTHYLEVMEIMKRAKASNL